MTSTKYQQRTPLHDNGIREDTELQDAHRRLAQELALEPEPPVFSRWFVVLAIVLFLTIGSSSVPNLLNIHNPKDDQGKALPVNKVSFRDPSLGAQDKDKLIPLVHALRTSARTTKERDYESMHVSIQTPDQKRESTVAVAGFSTNLHTDTASSFPSSNPVISPTPSSSPLVHDINIWPAISAPFRLLYHACLWISRKLYWSTSLFISKPLELTIAVAEPPYAMMRDISKAFLPVYSFFAVAAAIGIVVGGFATWIGQILIMALGADHERNNHSVAQVRSAHHLSSPYTSGSQLLRKPESLGSAISSFKHEQEDPETFERYTTRPLLIPKPASRIPQGSGLDGRHNIPSEDEDDEDDDDDADDDDDWHHA
ncbi:hypothetical protein BGZ50_004228 [Haplosporangium sp. Z 11]|nr:hypothetical protein BGZ50_004228 [Haplosporangium sp. Z 11]